MAKLEALGNNQAHLLTLIENLTDDFGSILNQMSTTAQYQMPEEGLQRVLFPSIEGNPVLCSIRSDMTQIKSDLEMIKQQKSEVLERLRLQEDVGENE